MNKVPRLLSSLPALGALAAVFSLGGAARAEGATCSSLLGAQGFQGAQSLQVAREKVPEVPVVRVQQPTDKVFYARLGYGALPGAQGSGGPDLGLGLRVELAHVGLDVSVNLGTSGIGPGLGFDALRGSVAKLTGQYFFSPDADASPYLGAGLSWGGESATVAKQVLSGNGLQAEAVAGYELFRTSSMRLFLQADATLPLYVARHQGLETPTIVQRGAFTARTQSGRYLPILGLSVGIGWGRTRAR